MNKLYNAGLVPPMQPMVDGHPVQPQLKIDLTKAPSNELGKELARFTSCTDYATFLSTVADAEATIAEQVLDSVTAQVRAEKTGTVLERSDKTTNDPRVIKAELEATQARIYSNLVQSLARNFERDAQAISREITRRGMDFHRNNQ